MYPVSEIGGGKFANGAITAAYVTIFNQLQHEIKKGHNGLTNYVNKHFKGRIPEGVSVMFDLTDEAVATISNALTECPKVFDIFIPKDIWTGDKRILYDAVDHELQHLDDYASGRAYKYSSTFDWGWATADIIMEYKAYSRNLRYDMRREKPLNSYGTVVNELKKKLPEGWEKIK